LNKLSFVIERLFVARTKIDFEDKQVNSGQDDDSSSGDPFTEQVILF
jgi:hypothetical protein